MQQLIARRTPVLDAKLFRGPPYGSSALPHNSVKELEFSERFFCRGLGSVFHSLVKNILRSRFVGLRRLLAEDSITVQPLWDSSLGLKLRDLIESAETATSPACSRIRVTLLVTEFEERVGALVAALGGVDTMFEEFRKPIEVNNQDG